MISSGSKELDEFLDGYGKEISLIYGPAASGKTTLCLICLCSMLKNDKKIVFLDTENSFSIERFVQLCGPAYLTMLDRLLLIKINSFAEQCEKINSLINLVNIDLIIVDSLGVYYRKEIHGDPKEINKKMDRQLRLLTEISRKGTHILLTNQISTNPADGSVKMVGGEMIKKWCKKVVELKKEPKRKIVLIKPEEKETYFDILSNGIKIAA